MNEFVTWVVRWSVRIVMLVAGVVFFLSLLAAAGILASVWALRALWAKLTGKPVTPWVMPMRAATGWANMAQRAGGFGGVEAQEEHAAASAPFKPSAGRKRGGALAKAASDVSDVQAREVH